MKNLLKYIYSLTDFSDESWKQLQGALTKREFKKNELLLKEGEVCNALFYIDKGYCRSYYSLDGIAKNTGFYFENDLTTNINSFGSGQKSMYNIIACEPLTTIIFNKEPLFQAAKHAPEIEILGRHCIRLFAAKQEEFANLFKLYAAKDRLAYLEKNHPMLLQRVPLSQLASFLGVARETLSRIRNRRVNLKFRDDCHS
ncbi:Crp/Fnr family transcriptional regulator [Olivibacter sp. SDN3]|uniref:Crp/Fnr family transcriptional regulator n=1 Tax=Olivibacter sp. SDN3 TaxID=2764720 RepID=UPI0016512214|nr:Crp/Fnr family transcriptional regulator [Olivibacter sp. SDN3]QNL48008.1 Crp/Fnr family transcriptional regulator [Olivibacter sp. SDN3]